LSLVLKMCWKNEMQHKALSTTHPGLASATQQRQCAPEGDTGPLLLSIILARATFADIRRLASCRSAACTYNRKETMGPDGLKIRFSAPLFFLPLHNPTGPSFVLPTPSSHGPRARPSPGGPYPPTGCTWCTQRPTAATPVGVADGSQFPVGAECGCKRPQLHPACAVDAGRGWWSGCGRGRGWRWHCVYCGW
jgi:hypothetical protein